MKSEYINIEVCVRTNIVGSKTANVVRILREDWEDMSEKERDELMLEHMFDMIEWNYEATE